MKKVIASVALFSLHVVSSHAATLKDIGVNERVLLNAAGKTQVCIDGTVFLYAKTPHVHAVFNDTDVMRLVTTRDELPFQALSFSVNKKTGQFTKRVVTVQKCAQQSVAQRPTVSQPRVRSMAPKMQQQTVARAVQPPPAVSQRLAMTGTRNVQPVGPTSSIRIPATQKSVAPQQPPISVNRAQKKYAVAAQYSGDTPPHAGKRKKHTYVRGALRSIDTFNVSYSHFSPFDSDGKERHGRNWNVKARVRPFQIGNLRVGVYGTFSDGESNAYRPHNSGWSYSDYETRGLGLSTLYDHGYNRSSSFDLGLLWQETENHNNYNAFRSWQEEKQLEARYSFSSDHRRMSGEGWLPYWEIGTQYIHPFDVDYRDTKGRGNDYAYDNKRIRIWGDMDLYDWYFGDANQWSITPTLNAQLGYLWGKESWYLQGGPGSKFGWRGQEIFDMNFVNPRWMLDGSSGRLYDFAGTWKVDNTFRAFYAERVRDYRPASRSNILVVD